MRVAVLYFPAKTQSKLQKISQALARGIEAQGHQVDLLDGSKDVNTKLSGHQYVAVGAELNAFFATKAPEMVSRYLKNAGLITGKRSFVYILPKPFGAEKFLRNLMSIMETEGMFIKFSEIMGDEKLATEIGKKLIIMP